MTQIYWPGTNVVKSQHNAFTAHLRRTEPVPTKLCKDCGKEKPLTTFSVPTGLACGQCRYARQKARQEQARHMGAYSRA